MALSINVDSFQNVTCKDAYDGNIFVTVSGGTPPYTYAWTRDGVAFSNNEDLTGLAGGSYELTVTDAASATVQVTQVLTEPSVMTLSITPDAPNRVVGSVLTAMISGGTGPYTYVWTENPSVNPPVVTNTFTPTQTGDYVLEITDQNGCTITEFFEVLDYPVFALDSLTVAGPQTAFCCGCIAVTQYVLTGTVQNGALPYTYTWTGPKSKEPTLSNSTTNEFTVDRVGIYTLTVTDSSNPPQVVSGQVSV